MKYGAHNPMENFLKKSPFIEHFNVIVRLRTLTYNFLTSLQNLQPLSDKMACGILLLQKRFTNTDAMKLARLSGRA